VLAEVIADPSDLRERGRARNATFTWERCAAQTLAVYESLATIGRAA